MTAEARVERLLGTQLGKCDDGCLSSVRLHMRLRRPVAPLAACVGRFFFADRNALEVGVLVELKPYVGMARFAGITADVSALLRTGILLIRLRRVSAPPARPE